MYNVKAAVYNETMPKTVPDGFTLIELLVVIAIMALIGAFSISNYRTFGEDQKLKNSSLDIQNILRSAQTSATTNAICNTLSGATWKVEFADATTINLKCQEGVYPAVLKKTLNLGTNIIIQTVTWTGSGCPSAIPPFAAFSVFPTLLSGRMDFGNPNCTSFTIALQNTKTSSFKSLTVEQGGRIYEP